MLIPTLSIVALRRFGRDRRGSAAIEFAFVAPFFFALIFAIIETALFFFASQWLETGVQDTGRIFYTSKTVTAADLKKTFCSYVDTLMSCDADKLCLDVRKYAKGASLTNMKSAVDAAGTYSCVIELPTATDVDVTMVVRGYYQWPLFVTGLGYNIGNIQGSNKRLLGATAAVRPQ
jgi:Flp pilus assembly protein TadG